MLERCLMVGTLLVCAMGCHGRGATTEPEPSSRSMTASDPFFDDEILLEPSTVRQHSAHAGTFVELSAGCPHEPEDVPTEDALTDDAIPQLDRSRSRRSNFHRGEERLQDIDLHQHMMGVQGQILACVDLAACYEDGAELLGRGDLDFDFEITSEGRVAAVSVTASPGLDHPSVIACARRTVYQTRFPSYDGGQMMVSYSMSIDEVDAEA